MVKASEADGTVKEIAKEIAKQTDYFLDTYGNQPVLYEQRVLSVKPFNVRKQEEIKVHMQNKI